MSEKKIVDLDTSTIYLYEDIGEEVSLEIIQGLEKLDRFGNVITIKINSLGGEYEYTIPIISSIKNSENHIVTQIDGIAYSGAGMIALAGDIRLISEFGEIMFHEPVSTLESGLDEIGKEYTASKEHYERITTLLLKETKLTLKRYCEKTNNKNWYINPKEALKLGIVNDIT